MNWPISLLYWTPERTTSTRSSRIARKSSSSTKHWRSNLSQVHQRLILASIATMSIIIIIVITRTILTVRKLLSKISSQHYSQIRTLPMVKEHDLPIYSTTLSSLSTLAPLIRIRISISMVIISLSPSSHNSSIIINSTTRPRQAIMIRSMIWWPISTIIKSYHHCFQSVAGQKITSVI